MMTAFYVEGHTAEGAPYGPVHVLTTPLKEGVSLGYEANDWEEAEQARKDAWRESEPMKEANAVMRSRGKGIPK